MNWQYIITNEILWLGVGLISLAVGIQLSEWLQVLINKLNRSK